MLRFEDYLEQRLQDEVLKYMQQNGYKNLNTMSPEFRALNDSYKQAYLSYNYGDSIAEKLRNNNATLVKGQFTKDTLNELLANEWNSKAGIETAKMVKSNPIDGLNPNEQMLNTIGNHLVNNRLITSRDNARKLEEFDSVFKPENNIKQKESYPVLEAGIEKNVISTPPENNKSKPIIEEYPEDMQPGDKVIKAGIEKNVSAYDLIQEDKSLSTEEKVGKIHELAEARNKEIEKEHKKKMSQYYAGAGLQFAAPFIPMAKPLNIVTSGIGKFLKPMENKVASIWGKKIAEESAKNISKNIVSNSISGIGDAMLNDNKIIPTSGEKLVVDTGKNLIINLLGNFAKKIKIANKLKNTDQINKLPLRQQRKLQDKATQYYDDYLEGTSVRTKDGSSIKFDKLKDKISPEKANTIPDLPKQIKKGNLKTQNDLNSMLGNSFEGNTPTNNIELEDWLRKLLKSHRNHI